MKLSEWKLYSIYALGHILQGSPEADKKYLKILFKYLMGKECNFDNPQTYSEKLQWLKIYDRNPLYTQLVDKYEVRKFIEERIGREHLIPCLGVWNHFDEIDFDKLPNQFVLKCTHDSGGLIICKDKSTLDIKIAGVKPAVPQLPKTDAIWGVAVLGSTETLESSAEKAGFCKLNAPCCVRPLWHSKHQR